MSAFMEEYEKAFSEIVCIPGVEMNRPYASGSVPGDVGLELEIEGRGLPTEGALEKIKGVKSNARWATKTDGSLRGESIEYVLNAPCMIDEVEPLVVGLYDKFSSSKTELLLTNRCSTHVHVNMTGKKINEITSAIALWTAFEEPLTLWAGEERVNNHFCLSAKDSNQGTVQAWRGFLRSGRARWGDNLKYSALNILTLNRFGSLEYRVMNASEDPRRIIDWTKFVFTLTRYAGDVFNNPKSLLYAMSERGGRDLFIEICARAGVSEEFVLGVSRTVSNLDRAVLDGFRRAQPLVAGFDWDAWMPEINKEYIANPFGTKKAKGFVIDVGPEPLENARRFLREPIARLDWDEPDEADIRPRPRGGRVFPGAVNEIAPPQPAPAPIPLRPDFVPPHYEYNARNNSWVFPNPVELGSVVDNILRRASRSVSFVRAPRARVDWSKAIQFTDGTSAITSEINQDGRMAKVHALDNITSNGNTLARGFWYNTDTGRWNSGDNTYPVVQNVPVRDEF